MHVGFCGVASRNLKVHSNSMLFFRELGIVVKRWYQPRVDQSPLRMLVVRCQDGGNPSQQHGQQYELGSGVLFRVIRGIPATGYFLPT